MPFYNINNITMYLRCNSQQEEYEKKKRQKRG